jgi:hypothetical protein
VEVDCGGEVIEVAEASGTGFQPLDFGVQAFADGVGDTVFGIGLDVFQTTFEHLRFVDHRFQAAFARHPLGKHLRRAVASASAAIDVDGQRRDSAVLREPIGAI